MNAPKHRKNALVRTEPRVQAAPKHRGVASIPAKAADISAFAGLLFDVGPGNPYRRRA